MISLQFFRAIYFWSYSTAKSTVNGYLPASNRDAPFVHVVSALTAGVSVSTLTNPIWLIKTRLQLDRTHSSKTLTIRKAVKQIYNEKVRILKVGTKAAEADN